MTTLPSLTSWFSHLYGGAFGISVHIWLSYQTSDDVPTLLLSLFVSVSLVNWRGFYFLLGINKIKMENSKLALKWLPILVLVLMVASISFVESSRKCLQVTTSTISENRETLGIQIKEADGEFGNGTKVFSTVDDSDRLVPTGPNPLHHRNNPIKP